VNLSNIEGHVLTIGDDSKSKTLTVTRSIRQRISALLDPDKVRRYLFRGADKKTIYGIVVGTLAETGDHQIVFDKVEQSLRLIEFYEVRQFVQIQRHIKSIFIFGDPTARGRWHQELQMCELNEEFVRDEDTSVAQIASVIVHEATHARLMRYGFGYEEPKRLRIEHICFSAQRAFARRLPNADELLTEIEETKSYYGEAYFSDAGQRDANLEGLRILGVPRWLVWLLGKLTSRRSRTNSRAKTSSH
jgi:hypothetical protein